MSSSANKAWSRRIQQTRGWKYQRCNNFVRNHQEDARQVLRLRGEPVTFEAVAKELLSMALDEDKEREQ